MCSANFNQAVEKFPSTATATQFDLGAFRGRCARALHTPRLPWGSCPESCVCRSRRRPTEGAADGLRIERA